MKPSPAIVLYAHGTVDALDDLPEFLTNIRRGHAPSAELLAEVRRRYETIGSSPLNRINHEVARAVEAALGVPTRLANRLFHPYAKDVIRALAAEGAKTIAVVPLAQHSAPVYAEAARAAAAEVDPSLEVVAASNWGRTPALTAAFAESVVDAIRKFPADVRADVVVLFTAHSLPQSVIDAGDPYETEFRASVADVAAKVRAMEAFGEHVVAFQSQGMSTGPGGRPMTWLGPDLGATLDAVVARGRSRVVVAPIGFLADHVEILYDLDIEAKAHAEKLGLHLVRSESLNATRGLVEALTVVAKGLLE